MNTPIEKELEEIRIRLEEIGREIYSHKDGWDYAAMSKHWLETTALLKRRRALWDSKEAKDLGLNGGVDHEIFY